MVRTLRDADRHAWLQMRGQLWPDGGADEHEAGQWLARANAVTLVAEHSSGKLIGFAEAGEREYADGCDSSPVAYLEGWYVETPYRHQGHGAALVAGVAAWARARHLTELASDSLLDNESALAAHLRNGFDEVERSVKFRKKIEG